MSIHYMRVKEGGLLLFLCNYVFPVSKILNNRVYVFRYKKSNSKRKLGNKCKTYDSLTQERIYEKQSYRLTL